MKKLFFLSAMSMAIVSAFAFKGETNLTSPAYYDVDCKHGGTTDQDGCITTGNNTPCTVLGTFTAFQASGTCQVILRQPN